MKEYFIIQYKMLNRKAIEFGMPLFLAYILAPFLFFIGSDFLFSKSVYANFLYIFIAVILIIRTSEIKRNDFLKSAFKQRQYYVIRVVENLILSIPFTAFLIYKKHLLLAVALVVLLILLALMNYKSKLNFTIPTPFSQKPFEFAIGFRRTFFIFPFAYFLTYKAISVSNFNLGVFSMILIALICISYYFKPEDEYFVWNYNLTVRDFLIEKIKTAVVFFTTLSISIFIALSIFFSYDIITLIVFFLLCNIYLATIILCKYSVCPKEINVPQIVLILVSLMFPPTLLAIIPYLYVQSSKNLTPLLNDSN